MVGPVYDDRLNWWDLTISNVDIGIKPCSICFKVDWSTNIGEHVGIPGNQHLFHGVDAL